jgi:hypothetical protein
VEPSSDRAVPQAQITQTLLKAPQPAK